MRFGGRGDEGGGEWIKDVRRGRREERARRLEEEREVELSVAGGVGWGAEGDGEAMSITKSSIVLSRTRVKLGS